MPRSRLLAGVALAALCLPVAALNPHLPLGATAAHAQSASVSFQLFFDELQPHGVWVRHDRYRYVFCPTGVDAQWRPYTNGRWLYLEDRGWYFASEEPYAWATYHYGRWFADQELGWCWVPGTKWAPAWVSWRSSDDVVGWAPLPPENDGYVVSLEVSRRELPAAYWVYVPTQRFVEPDLSVSIVFGNTQPEYYTQTRYLGPVVVEGDVVINNVIEVNYIEQVIGQQVVVYQTEQAAAPAEQAVTADSQVIAVFDQDVAEANAEATPPEAVDEAEAVEVISSQGGTAGATAEIATEGEGTVEATDTEGDAEAQVEPAPEEGNQVEPAADAAAATDAEAAAESETEANAVEEAVPADAEEADVDAEADAEAAAEAEADADAEPAAEVAPTEEQAPDAAPVDSQSVEEPAAEEPAADVPADVAADQEVTSEEAARADAAPVEDEAATEEVAPTEGEVQAEPDAEAAAPAEGEPTEELNCLPEELVDGVCPVAPQQ